MNTINTPAEIENNARQAALGMLRYTLNEYAQKPETVLPGMLTISLEEFEKDLAPEDFRDFEAALETDKRLLDEQKADLERSLASPDASEKARTFYRCQVEKKADRIANCERFLNLAR